MTRIIITDHACDGRTPRLSVGELSPRAGGVPVTSHGGRAAPWHVHVTEPELPSRRRRRVAVAAVTVPDAGEPESQAVPRPLPVPAAAPAAGADLNGFKDH